MIVLKWDYIEKIRFVQNDVLNVKEYKIGETKFKYASDRILISLKDKPRKYPRYRDAFNADFNEYLKLVDEYQKNKKNYMILDQYVAMYSDYSDEIIFFCPWDGFDPLRFDDLYSEKFGIRWENLFHGKLNV